MPTLTTPSLSSTMLWRPASRWCALSACGSRSVHYSPAQADDRLTCILCVVLIPQATAFSGWPALRMEIHGFPCALHSHISHQPFHSYMSDLLLLDPQCSALATRACTAARAQSCLPAANTRVLVCPVRSHSSPAPLRSVLRFFFCALQVTTALIVKLTLMVRVATLLAVLCRGGDDCLP
jgi:hypothetical protein